MSSNLIMLAFDQMKYDMRCEPILSFLVTEPLPACLVAALYHAAFVANGAVGACMHGQIFLDGLRGATV